MLTLGSATCLTPGPPTVYVVRHSTKLLSLTLAYPRPVARNLRLHHPNTSVVDCKRSKS